MRQSDTILEVKNLCTDFLTDDGIFRAIDHVSFSLRRGETIGIVGESGSGKSVTSLSVMGLLPHPAGRITSGEILFDSPSAGYKNLVSLPQSSIRKIRGKEISMIFQEPMTSLNPVFSCGYQVVEAIQNHLPLSKADAKARTLELFNMVQLPRVEQIFQSFPHQLSGGQKQRVMIAMAMACNPSILIADEPTTALDVTVQKRILDLMRKLRDDNDMSIVFITHDLGVIAEIADRVVVMYKGKIVEQGSVLDIFKNPQHPYTKGLLACRPRLDMRMKVLPTVSNFMREKPDGSIMEVMTTVDAMIKSESESPEAYRERQAKLASQPPILEVQNLKTYFPVKSGLFGKVKDHVRAVDDVTFDVKPGETLGLVGESGCGKTTLGRSVLRLVEPTEGTVRFMGKDLLSLNDVEMTEVRKDLQIIFQDPYSSLNPRITIGNAILEPMHVHELHGNDRARREKVYELLERVNLKAEHFNRYPHEFSGGQRQRICIARVLAVQPKFIICDESVSALDVSVQAQVLNLLNSLKREFGLSYVFISHDLSVVKFMSDRMLVMNKGKVEEAGYCDDIYHHPEQEYTKTLINAIPKGSLEDIERLTRERMARFGATVVT